MTTGLAKTNQFLLSMATVMVGPMSKLFELTPAVHSIGLVKNVRVQTETQQVELMQGVTNDLVYSVNTTNNVTVNCDVFEHTAQNLAYGAGLDANTGWTPNNVVYAPSANVMAADTTITIAGTGNLTGWNVGDWLVMQADGTDLVWVARVTAVNATTRTLTFAATHPLPAGVTWTAATTKIWNVKPVPLGNNGTNFLSCKMVGLLPEQTKPITLIFPKVRVTSGISLAFQNNEFAAMPFAFQPYSLIPSDTFFSEFPQSRRAYIFSAQ